MVSLSPKRLRTKLLDRLRSNNSRQNSQESIVGKPIPIFETSLVHATVASRLSPDAPSLAALEADTSDGKSAIDLDSLYRFWCPAVVVRCITYLTIHGLNEEGLYRVPGSSETIKRLRNDFNCLGDVNLEAIELHERQHGIQIADVASLLKQYLRELSSPILHGDVIRDLEAAVESLATLRSLLSTRISSYDFYLLSILCTHLSMVDAQSSTNKMDTHNLSIVFCSSSNLGIGTNLFTALARESVWTGLRSTNEQSALEEEERAKLQSNND